MKIGIYTGAKNSLSPRLLIKLGPILIKKLTIFVTTMRSVAKISFLRMSSAIKKLLKERGKPKKRRDMIIFL
jgi:hypothetical protein